MSNEEIARRLSLVNAFKVYGTLDQINKVVAGRSLTTDDKVMIDYRFTLGQVTLLFIVLTNTLSLVPYGTLIDIEVYELWIELRTLLLQHQVRDVA